MKTARQLLWFIFPTMCIFLLFCIFLFLPKVGESSVFISDQQYIRLLLKDPFFLKSLFYSLAFPFILAFVMELILFIIGKSITKKHNIKYFNIYYYTILFIFSFSIFYLNRGLRYVWGLPTSAYNVRSLLSTHNSFYFSVPVILVAIQAALILCFLHWLINKLILKYKR